MSYTFKKAIRENVNLILALAGGTGSGKTFSAMRLAQGMAGSKRYAVIDTENGRASHYADQFDFDTCDLRAPFRPESYADAILAADKAGYPVIVVDSMSHVWAGDGGVLDWQEGELDRMAGDDWKKREACKMAAWIKPKMAHKHMMSKLLQVKAHLILCFRAEEKIEMVRGEGGKMEVRQKHSLTGKDGWIPICEKSVPFEATASFLLLARAPGLPNPIKLPEAMKAAVMLDEALNEKTGEKLAQWAAGGEVKRKPVPFTQPVPVNHPVGDQAQGGPQGNERAESSTKESDNLRHPEPPADRSVDMDLAKQEFDARLASAQNFKQAAAVREEVLNSDLPQDYKSGFEIRFKSKFAEKKR